MAMSTEAIWEVPSSAFKEPRAIPILTVSERGQLELDDEALTNILRNPELENKPISIVSIAGAFRKGKSLMLNIFMKYLRRKGYQDAKWKGSFTDPLNRGFEWRGGESACTHGILIWSEVFTIAVLLMDTQGLFDNKTDTKTNTLIFALSTLISSVQIFNLSQQIQENDLTFLEHFTSYAKAASEDSKYCGDVKPFQTLIFLIRDWPYGERGGYGCDPGRNHLEKVLNTSNSSSNEIKEVRKYLKSSFENLRCCLMPYPGETVATTEAFNGCFKDISKKFIDELDPFLERLFKPDNLIEKRINGQRVTSSTILGYIRGCSEQLTAGKLPDPKPMLENIADAQNFEACKFCTEKYVEFMNGILGHSYVEEGLLTDLHSQNLDEVLQEFEIRTKIGTEKMRQRHRDYLRSSILREYERLRMVNHARKIEREKNVLELVGNLSRLYEEHMAKETEGKEYLDDKDFDDLHYRTANHAMNKFFDDSSVSVELKGSHVIVLEGGIKRIHEQFKKKNEEKRRIAKEKDAMEKFLMKTVLECSIWYREAMAKCIKNYVEESELENMHKWNQDTTLINYEAKLLQSSQKIPNEKSDEYKKNCIERIFDEYGAIEKANIEKKKLLKKTLENKKAQICVEYDKYFSKALKDNYLEPAVLLELHTKFVDGVTREIDESYWGQANVPIFAEHKKEVREELEQRYSTTEEWNENNTILNKFFIVIKSVVSKLSDLPLGPIMALIRTIILKV